MWYVKKQLNDQPNGGVIEEVAVNEMPADFPTFLDRFSTDSLFQMDRIAFPLKGLPAYADSLTLASGDYTWYKHEWVMHKPFNEELGNFKREYDVAGESLVIETIVDQQSGYGMQRRFAKLSDEWHLIYYVAINKLK